jgi:uncharacterized surface protein with fasciclin (FAS1) repeats
MPQFIYLSQCETAPGPIGLVMIKKCAQRSRAALSAIAIPSATLTKVLANKAELTKILTYHVVGGTVSTSDFSMGTKEKTLEGAKVTLGKMGSTYTVNGAKVVCGDVTTSNATVYVISSVLMPKS